MLSAVKAEIFHMIAETFDKLVEKRVPVCPPLAQSSVKTSTGLFVV